MVFSLDAQFATREYHEWLCEFRSDTWIERLWDLVNVDIEMAEECEVWNALPAADKQEIATLFRLNQFGQPRFVKQAAATLQALCRSRMYTCSRGHQEQAMYRMWVDIKYEREHIMRKGGAGAREQATCLPILSMPRILWKHSPAFGKRASAQPLSTTGDCLWGTLDHQVLWLVFSLDAKFATREYHEWLRDFFSELGIERLRDLVSVDIKTAEASKAWNTLSAEDQQDITTLFWVQARWSVQVR